MILLRVVISEIASPVQCPICKNKAEMVKIQCATPTKNEKGCTTLLSISWAPARPGHGRTRPGCTLPSISAVRQPVVAVSSELAGFRFSF